MKELKAIYNCRDLGESVSRNSNGSKILPHLLFRSATLDHAKQEELDYLVKDMQIKTVLDLRSELEAKLAELGKPFLTFPIAASLKLDPADILNPDPSPEAPKVKPRIMHRRASVGANVGTRKTIMINFAGSKFRKYAVWWPAPFWCKVRIAGFFLAGQKVSAARIAGVEIMNKKGLEGLYRDFIDFCDQEMNEALHILADPSNYPVLVHCTHGKDRTGLVIALALAAVGVDEEQIFQDYAKSTEGLSKVRAQMVQELSVNGLDPSFADTPYETIKKTFDHIKSKYGSVDEYLHAIGFGEKQQQLLKMIIVDDRKPCI